MPTLQTENKQLRSFGLIVGGIFGIIGIWPLIFRGEVPRFWAIGTAACLMLSGLVLPRCLSPIYRIWMALGQILGKINTRVILSLIFYGLFTPAAIFRRLVFSRDPLHCRFDPEKKSYRVLRKRRAKDHLARQF